MKKFKVSDPRTFRYLNQTNCYEVAHVDDAREYIETRNAMDVVGINQEEQVDFWFVNLEWIKHIHAIWYCRNFRIYVQEAIFRMVAAILHLGNINFDKGNDMDSSKLKDKKSIYHLNTAAELLMCDTRTLLIVEIFSIA